MIKYQMLSPNRMKERKRERYLKKESALLFITKPVDKICYIIYNINNHLSLNI